MRGLFLFTLCWVAFLDPAFAQPPKDDPAGAWRIKGVDAVKSNWTGDFVLKSADGKLTGWIDWAASGGDYDGASGREIIAATFDAETRVLKLKGVRLEDAADIELGEYTAQLSADGAALAKGTWSTYGAGGSWTAKRVAAVAEPSKPTTIETGFIRKRFTRPDGSETRYFVYVPRRYDGKMKTPVILFLHGSGETKGEGGQPTEVGLGPYIREHEKTFEHLVVFPQAQEEGWAKNKDLAMAILEKTEAEYKTDPRKVYLTGLSMGGIGVWDFAASAPLRWAAIIPICGTAKADQAHKISHIPCWAFHGANDKVIPPDGTRDMIAALKKVGGTPKYTEYSKMGHACWDTAYATPELWRWLEDQRRR